MKLKTSKADFEQFKGYCEQWKQLFGLQRWSFFYDHTDIRDMYAQTNSNSVQLAATIQLATKWDDMRPKNERELYKLAAHEVLHVLLAPLCSEAEYRYSTEDAIQSAEHAVVRTLETILVGDSHAKV
jgi:hypothetical protein